MEQLMALLQINNMSAVDMSDEPRFLAPSRSRPTTRRTKPIMKSPSAKPAIFGAPIGLFDAPRRTARRVRFDSSCLDTERRSHKARADVQPSSHAGTFALNQEHMARIEERIEQAKAQAMKAQSSTHTTPQRLGQFIAY